MLFAEGLPMFLLELAIGQRLRKGSLGVWNRVSPFWGGIGVASAIVSFNVALYYNTVIAWCLSYFVQVSKQQFIMMYSNFVHFIFMFYCIFPAI